MARTAYSRWYQSRVSSQISEMGYTRQSWNAAGFTLFPDAKASVPRRQILAGALSVATPPLPIDDQTKRLLTRTRVLRGMAVIVTGPMIRVAPVGVRATRMRMRREGAEYAQGRDEQNHDQLTGEHDRPLTKVLGLC
jgi:hypothetical protein